MFSEIDSTSPLAPPLRADVPFLHPFSDDARPVVLDEVSSPQRGMQPDDRRAVRIAFAQALADRLTGDGMGPDEAAAWLTHYRETGAIDAGVSDYATAWARGNQDELPDIDPAPPRRSAFATIGHVLVSLLGFAFPAVRGVALVAAAAERQLADIALDPSLRRR